MLGSKGGRKEVKRCIYDGKDKSRGVSELKQGWKRSRCSGANCDCDWNWESLVFIKNCVLFGFPILSKCVVRFFSIVTTIAIINLSVFFFF